MLGVFGTLTVNATGANGLLYGNSHFFWIQLGAIAISSVYAFGFTYLMLAVINLFTRVKTTAEEEQTGLD